jgi:PD-(D/E)XK nuclease superfamily
VSFVDLPGQFFYLPSVPIRVIRGALMKHEELSREIIGAAMTVLNELKPGLDERLYENAMVIELQARGHQVE